MRRIWVSALLLSVSVVLCLAGIGWWFGLSPLALALVGALLMLAWQISELHRFERWLRQDDKTRPRWVLFKSLYSQLERTYRRKGKRKRKVQHIVRKYQQAIAALPDAAVLFDKAGNIVWSNKAAQSLLGLRGEQDIGTPISKLLRHPNFLKLLNDPDCIAVQMPAPLNVQITLELRQAPYGKKQILLLATDISERQRLEQMRRDFVGNVSHELRTPLTVIVGYLETILDADPPAHWLQPLRTIERQSDRMMHIVEDLLLLSRLETDTDIEQLPKKLVDVSALLSDLMVSARSLSEDKHQIELDVDEPSEIMGIEKELHSAFSNLIFNAIRYTQAGGQIKINWSVDDETACFSVSDNGPGIAEHHIPRLSERFYRVDRSRQRVPEDKQGGTGLGLSIVKHVMQRHGGRLHIASCVGEGSCFSCYFPVSCCVACQSAVTVADEVLPTTSAA